MKLIVIIPTYNERATIVNLIKKILKLPLNLDILVIDDNSEDKTGEIVEKLKNKNQELKKRLKIIHRPKKLGIGTAYLLGFDCAKEYDYIFSMDADLSHNPSDIPRLFKKAREGFDLVIGSRYIKGGKILNWPYGRYLLSRLANLLARFLLGLKALDVTAGFKCYSKKAIKILLQTPPKSPGYGFQVETVYRLQKANLNIAEIPIAFKGRLEGESKISKKELIGSILSLGRLFIKG